MHEEIKDLSLQLIKHRIDCALGRCACELCQKNLKWVDVFSGEIVDNAEIFIDNLYCPK